MTQNKLVIGITGGIGSGKSTASSYLRDKGYPVVDADVIARQIVEIGKPAYSQIVAAFGETILAEDQTIDRAKLGQIVFKDNDQLEMLNQITHPKIHEEIMGEIEGYKANHKVVFADIPLLFEAKDRYTFDEVWLIYADETSRVKRIINRDHVSEEYALIKINNQMSLEDKRKLATRVLDNSSEKDYLYKQIELALSTL